MTQNFTHLGRRWRIVFEARHWFVRDDLNSDTGPFSSAQAARDWVTAIVPGNYILDVLESDS